MACLCLFKWVLLGYLVRSLNILIKPIMWILLLFWKLSPKTLKKSVEKLYNKLAGKYKINQEYLLLN